MPAGAADPEGPHPSMVARSLPRGGLGDSQRSTWMCRLSHSPALQTSPCVRRAIINCRKQLESGQRGKGDANREAPTTMETNITQQKTDGVAVRLP